MKSAMKPLKYLMIMKTGFQNAIAYRAAAIAQLCFCTLFIYVFVSLWRAIYHEGGVHGYDYSQIIWYLIMTEFITFLCGVGVLNNINEEVKTGSIVYQIGRPVHYVLYQFASSMGQVLFNFLTFGPLSVILGLLFVGPLRSFRLEGLPMLALSIGLSVILNFFILVLIGLSALVVEDNFALFLIYQKLGFMLGMFLPVEFLPAWLQPVAKALPFSYVYWAQAKLFVNFSSETCVELIPRQAAWATAAVIVALASYRLCVRRLAINGG